MEILSQLWSFLGLLTVLQNILPSQLLSLLNSFYESLQDLFTPYSYFEIPEFNGYCGVDVNDLYRHVNLYLNSLNSASQCRRLTLSRSKSSKNISFTVAPNHTVHDSFNGHTLSWTHHVDTVQDSLEEKRSFTLKLPKRHRQTLLSPYLHHVTSRAEDFERVSRERRLFTNNGHASYESGGDVDMAMKEVVTAMQTKILGGGGTQREVIDCDDMMVVRSPESVLVVGSPENWDSSPGKNGGKKRSNSKVNFLVRLRSLTKSDSGRRGV
ncbi:hypothetical protein Pint_24124 [Pistacia integerrima]|uniref:Uncharacterized protein n=1 Tax=Pistacia integerrima TaxID=434235 RepID=A0ACC0YH97_9ROSI|nr:hypothetical protein Pint_24124 [Pistacia integerrima]